MRRAVAITAALGLIGVGAVTARADSPDGTIPNCANVNGGVGTYDAGTGTLHMEVRLKADPCDGAAVTNDDGSVTTTTANYALYVIKDKSWSPDPAKPTDVNMFNLTGPWDQAEFITSDYSVNPLAVTQFTQPTAHVITYDVVIDDDDPTLCVFSYVTGSTVTTREGTVANQPVDQNGNGNTSDDTHNGNGGETNKDKEKFDWGTTTTSERTVVDFFDRAPTEGEGQTALDSTKCLPVDAFTTLAGQVVDDLTSSGGQGYN
jgi:hypothetical protein